MIDININTIISQALAAAVQQAIQPLQQEYANKMAEMAEKITALEMRLTLGEKLTPAQGVDTTLEETLQRLDNQEWFWAKIRNFTDTAVEQAIENHTDMYDHSDFVTEDKLDDYVQKDSFRDEVEDVLNNATIRFRF